MGPLEVVDNGEPVAVHGNKQRATLGYLLLHANSVVATSRLLNALWPNDVPNTGRKMIQNAVSALRGLLTPDDRADDFAVLLTHAPGYLLKAPAEAVDLNRFRDLVDDGRAYCTAGAWQEGASTLRAALDLWRGPVLADLVESGVDWSELAAVDNARLAAFEDYVEAEFACGRHDAVLHELETWFDLAPLRERLCGQLMRALYRSGRQADALGVYRRTRAELIDDLGLDPGPELQELERAILHQDLFVEPNRQPDPPVPAERAHRPQRSPVEVVPAARSRSTTTEETAELKQISALLVWSKIHHGTDATRPDEVDDALRRVATAVREEAESFGGVLGGTIGPQWLVLFGPAHSREDDAVRAVRAALAIRERLRSRGLAGPDTAKRTSAVAVASGEALVRPNPAGAEHPPVATGGVLDRCLHLLTTVPPNQVRVCSETRLASEPTITYHGPHDPILGSLATAAPATHEPPGPVVPLVDREREVDVLFDALDRVRRRSRPHLVTVFGEAGVGKSRLVDEFHRAATDHCPPVPVITCVASPESVHDGLSALAEALSARPGTDRSDPAPHAEPEMIDAEPAPSVSRSAPNSSPTALRALLSTGGPSSEPRESTRAWRRFLERICTDRPVVLIVEDLHRASNLLLDFIDDITADSGRLSLLVVVTARTELLDRRPSWGGGKSGAGTITLDPLDEDQAARLFVSSSGNEATAGIARSVIPHIGGNPLFVVEYARTLAEQPARLPEIAELRTTRDPRGFPVPTAVRRVLTARFDRLPTEVKAVLVDAAVLGSGIGAPGVHAIGGLPLDEVADALEHLTHLGYLRAGGRASEARTYEFRHSLVRAVAHATVPQAVLTEKERRAAGRIDADAAHHHGETVLGERSSA
ncbi:BTAD domain-containing putative transcriptional regulator [Saccharopolyspora sp. NPDC002578]